MLKTTVLTSFLTSSFSLLIAPISQCQHRPLPKGLVRLQYHLESFQLLFSPQSR
jgi:hypothetical protein